MMSEEKYLGETNPVPPSGYYRVRLFGRGGGLLYDCIVPPSTSFQWVCPSHIDGLRVYGFEIVWESD